MEETSPNISFKSRDNEEAEKVDDRCCLDFFLKLTNELTGFVDVGNCAMTIL